MIGKSANPTHKVSFWGVRCYLDNDNGYLWGVNSFYDHLIPVAAWFHNFMSIIAFTLIPSWEQQGFLLRVIEDYRTDGI